jgi:hypothetical protein
MEAMNTRSNAGRLGQKRGAVFEKYLREHLFAPALVNKLFLRIDRQHPDMIPTRTSSGEQGPPLFRLGKRAGSDWIVLMPKGCPFAYLAIEAKSIEGETLPLAKLENHQIEHLNQSIDAGQQSLLMVQFLCPLPEVYAVPWGLAPWRKMAQGHSLARAQLSENWRVRNWRCLSRVLLWTP